MIDTYICILHMLHIITYLFLYYFYKNMSMLPIGYYHKLNNLKIYNKILYSLKRFCLLYNLH